jgi:translation initiation factor 1 (eIF-1/SUI1)
VPSAPAAEESKETPQSKKPVKKIPKVTICVNKKNFNRSVTIVTGLEAFGE